nr:hypothetical protein [Tanacetum cinerariifolium]
MKGVGRMEGCGIQGGGEVDCLLNKGDGGGRMGAYGNVVVNVVRVKKLEMMNKAFKLRRLQKVGTTQKIETSDDTVIDDVSKQGRIIADMDTNKDVTLKDVVFAKDVKDAGIEEITAASATITAAAPQLTTVAAPTLTIAPSAA